MRSAVLMLLFFFLNCPKRVGPTTNIIEVAYVGSIYDDIFQDKPVLASAPDTNRITIGDLKLPLPFLDTLMERIGFYEALAGLPVDYVIMDRPVFGYGFFPIKRSMGYCVTNYKGLRFGIVSRDKDALSISDETMLALVRERSDIVWIVDKAFLKLPPVLVDFRVEGRMLSDTAVKALKVSRDSTAGVKIGLIRELLNGTLNREIVTGTAGLKEYALREIGSRLGANVVLYPPAVFRGTAVKDRYRLGEVLNMTACGQQFKTDKMNRSAVETLARERQYQVWGDLKKNNIVAVPSDSGLMIFDALFDDTGIK